jgi:hypothetical protein
LVNEAVVVVFAYSRLSPIYHGQYTLEGALHGKEEIVVPHIIVEHLIKLVRSSLPFLKQSRIANGFQQ